MLGGSSGINFLVHTRPSAKDLDSWATQAPRWSWDSLQPYFARHETLLPDPRSGERPKYFVRDTEIHGHSGPVIISWSPTPPSITSAEIDAVSEVSVPCEYKDLSAGRHHGFAHHLTTVDRRDGKIERSYAANAYLEPILDRPNLHILTKATAFQIVLEGNPCAARGVRYLHQGNEFEVKASREVILSASTIQSPRLLELSGIGNPEILRAAGTKCLVELPEVGENLHEHPVTSVSYELTKSTDHVTMDSLFTNPEFVQAEVARLMQTGEGLLVGTRYRRQPELLTLRDSSLQRSLRGNC